MVCALLECIFRILLRTTTNRPHVCNTLEKIRPSFTLSTFIRPAELSYVTVHCSTPPPPCSVDCLRPKYIFFAFSNIRHSRRNTPHTQSLVQLRDWFDSPVFTRRPLSHPPPVRWSLGFVSVSATPRCPRFPSLPSSRRTRVFPHVCMCVCKSKRVFKPNKNNNKP